MIHIEGNVWSKYSNLNTIAIHRYWTPINALYKWTVVCVIVVSAPGKCSDSISWSSKQFIIVSRQKALMAFWSHYIRSNGTDLEDKHKINQKCWLCIWRWCEEWQKMVMLVGVFIISGGFFCPIFEDAHAYLSYNTVSNKI